MNSALRKEIIDAHRVGGAQIPDIARFYGFSEVQVEKVLFPNGRHRKVLPATLPKIAKTVSTLYGTDGIIRIPGEMKKLVPLSESKLRLVHSRKSREIDRAGDRAGHTPSKAKTPEGRLAALKAWETMRKQQAEKRGEIYTPRTIEELKILAGISSEPAKVEVAVPATVIPSPQPVPAAQISPKTPVTPSPREDDLDIDYKPIVETGRVVDAYCSQHGITLKELLESHQQLMLITKLVHKP